MTKGIQLPLVFEHIEKTQSDTSKVPIDNQFPVEKANALASLESYNKHLYRPNTYFHKWWARRSGTTFRYILKQLIQDKKRQYYYEPGGLEGQVVLDPMMGGGTILHEAIRLGANVIGIDIDPIPVLQTEATLTLSEVGHRERVYRKFFGSLRAKLSAFYNTFCPDCRQQAETQFILYGLRRACSCREVLVVDNLTIREDSPDNVMICPKCHTLRRSAHHECLEIYGKEIVTKGENKCKLCGTKFRDILNQPFVERYEPLIVVGYCTDHGQFYKPLENHDNSNIEAASKQAEKLDFGTIEDFQIPRGPKSDDLLRRRIRSYLDLFTHRQLLYIYSCRDLILEVPEGDRVWLSLLISTSLEFNSLLCGYKGGAKRRPGAIRHVFSHHAYSFPYIALENNPIFSGKTSGTLNRLFCDRIAKAGIWAKAPIERQITEKGTKKIKIIGEIDSGQPVTDWAKLRTGTRKYLLLQADSASIPIPRAIADHIVTDPPYYDSVQYSDLSNFFRVWLRTLLPKEADWMYDYSTSAVSNEQNSNCCVYLDVLTRIWKTCSRALKPGGRLIFTYHHWQADAWADLTLSLRKARFKLINRYIIVSENPISVHIRGLKAIKHDAILVLCSEGNHNVTREWLRLETVRKDDSYTFCHDCGTVLGWLLDSERSDNEIRSEWSRLLGGA